MRFPNGEGKKVIDISDVQRRINWDAAKAAGLWGAILKLGSGDDLTSQDSDCFESFVAECEKREIQWGAYIYSYAMSIAEIQSEINHCVRRLQGKKPTLPIYIDMEDTDGYKIRHGGVPDSQTITNMIKAFCTGMEAKGFFVGRYYNKDWRDNHLYHDQLANWTFWFARPGVNVPEGNPPMWQCGTGETGSTWPGVPGLCDTDICYEDFPGEIKAAGLNGWGNATPTSTPAPAPAPQPAPTHIHHVGEDVVFSTCYCSSTDPINKAISADKMSRNHGVITKVLDGVHNPYLLDNGLCWVNDGDIRGPHSASSSAATSPQPSYRTYVTKSGDCLSVIAENLLGHASRYPEIMKLNNMTSDEIGIGQTLEIPIK